ncbi:MULTISPECIES: glycohydrolase toxin TNT-related protein [Clostridium]|nr:MULTISPECIES: glycohydrolase toxin TNT-related protein [Clostridium]MDB1953174.1 glycohydrolase toxin TNT-related protein [Clostridium tertium]MDU3524767.1 glycohydrolase toxin TNT-related protein [Clostridium sp.]MDU3549184.1 glycohydrolase toxin TNT-related protein [Clostridium sp.]MDU6363174.1 glycohydrolase toxin TNT-related protein [Clostridium sp.]
MVGTFKTKSIEAIKDAGNILKVGYNNYINDTKNFSLGSNLGGELNKIGSNIKKAAENLKNDKKIQSGIDVYDNLSDSKLVEGVSNPNRVFKNTQELLKETTCSNEKLYQYLKSNDDYFKTSYAEQYLSTGKWPDNIQTPKSSDVLTSKGSIDWRQVPDSGYVLDSGGKAIKVTYFSKKGEIIDRYGPSDGIFISPVIYGKPYSYDNRSLPYIDDLSKYHQYELTDDLSKLSDYIRNCTDKELVQDINDFMVYKKIKSYDDLISYKGEIASGFGSIGGGIQYQLPLPLDILEELGFLKTIK